MAQSNIRSSFTSTVQTPPPNLLTPQELAVRQAGLATQRAQLENQEAKGLRAQDVLERLLGYVPGDVGGELQSRGLLQSSLLDPTVERASFQPRAQLEDIAGDLGIIPFQQRELSAQSALLSSLSWDNWLRSVFGPPVQTFSNESGLFPGSYQQTTRTSVPR